MSQIRNCPVGNVPRKWQAVVFSTGTSQRVCGADVKRAPLSVLTSTTQLLFQRTALP